jgi:hypothetical protein
VAESVDQVGSWFASRIPIDWFVSPPRIVADREEIAVVGRVPEPTLPAGATAADAATARTGRIQQFREDTRQPRMRIAAEAAHRFGRKISWGAACGDVEEVFTSVSVPVMTRLRMSDRAVLDTLVDAGVARSRSEALAWCVRLVGRHQGPWIQELREALRHVEKVRVGGPSLVQEEQGRSGAAAARPEA